MSSYQCSKLLLSNPTGHSRYAVLQSLLKCLYSIPMIINHVTSLSFAAQMSHMCRLQCIHSKFGADGEDLDSRAQLAMFRATWMSRNEI